MEGWTKALVWNTNFHNCVLTSSLVLTPHCLLHTHESAVLLLLIEIAPKSPSCLLHLMFTSYLSFCLQIWPQSSGWHIHAFLLPSTSISCFFAVSFVVFFSLFHDHCKMAPQGFSVLDESHTHYLLPNQPKPSSQSYLQVSCGTQQELSNLTHTHAVS